MLLSHTLPPLLHTAGRRPARSLWCRGWRAPGSAAACTHWPRAARQRCRRAPPSQAPRSPRPAAGPPCLPAWHVPPCRASASASHSSSSSSSSTTRRTSRSSRWAPPVDRAVGLLAAPHLPPSAHPQCTALLPQLSQVLSQPQQASMAAPGNMQRLRFSQPTASQGQFAWSQVRGAVLGTEYRVLACLRTAVCGSSAPSCLLLQHPATLARPCCSPALVGAAAAAALSDGCGPGG